MQDTREAVSKKEQKVSFVKNKVPNQNPKLKLLKKQKQRKQAGANSRIKKNKKYELNKVQTY